VYVVDIWTTETLFRNIAL